MAFSLGICQGVLNVLFRERGNTAQQN